MAAVRQSISRSASWRRTFCSISRSWYEHQPVAHLAKTNPLRHARCISFRGQRRENRATSWGQQDLEADALRSMWVFLFPDLVFPCLLILPLSGVSAQVSSQRIGPDWDGRNSWSTLTCGPMIVCVWGCENIEAKVFVFFLCTHKTHTETHTVSSEKFSTYQVTLSHLPAKFGGFLHI